MSVWRLTPVSPKDTVSFKRSYIGDPLVLWCACFPDIFTFSPERKETGSLGATESEVWIGNFSVKAWKTTEHKPHKIWRSLTFCKISGKQAHPSDHVAVNRLSALREHGLHILGRWTAFNFGYHPCSASMTFSRDLSMGLMHINESGVNMTPWNFVYCVV